MKYFTPMALVALLVLLPVELYRSGVCATHYEIRKELRSSGTWFWVYERNCWPTSVIGLNLRGGRQTLDGARELAKQFKEDEGERVVEVVR